jgi:hypothetical protein
MERVLIRHAQLARATRCSRGPLLHALRRAWPRASLRRRGPAPLLELLSADPSSDDLGAWPARPGARRWSERLQAWRPDAALVPAAVVLERVVRVAHRGARPHRLRARGPELLLTARAGRPRARRSPL